MKCAVYISLWNITRLDIKTKDHLTNPLDNSDKSQRFSLQPLVSLWLLVVWKRSRYINAYIFSIDPFQPRFRQSTSKFQNQYHYPKDPWDWYTHVHGWLMFKVNVSKHTIHGSYGPPNIPKSLVNHFFRGLGERVRVIVLSLSCPVVSFYSCRGMPTCSTSWYREYSICISFFHESQVRIAKENYSHQQLVVSMQFEQQNKSNGSISNQFSGKHRKNMKPLYTT